MTLCENTAGALYIVNQVIFSGALIGLLEQAWKDDLIDINNNLAGSTQVAEVSLLVNPLNNKFYIFYILHVYMY